MTADSMWFPTTIENNLVTPYAPGILGSLMDNKGKSLSNSDLRTILLHLFFPTEWPIWNLNQLKSALDNYGLPSNEGFKIPFLYFGTKGAKFGPHSEEDRLCSINFLHFIESTYPKVWYSVAREDKLKVEFFLQNYAPEMFQHCQNAMEHRYHFLEPQWTEKRLR